LRRHLAFPLALISLLAAAPAAAVETQRVSDPAAEVRDYWTQARMRAAEPLGADPAAEPSSRALDCLPVPSRMCAKEVPDPTALGVRTHGKVYFSVAKGDRAGDYVCSGTVVNSRKRSVVWTAGHCVYAVDEEGDGDVPGFVANWIFVPAYDEGAQPFGQWPAKRLATTGPWQAAGNIKYDLGAAVVRRDAEGRRLQNVVGARGIAFDQPRQRTYEAIGYPAENLPTVTFDGEREFSCTSDPVANDDPGTAGPATMAIRCDMTGGSSGGGWISYGKLYSVTSYGYSQELDRLYGPYMSASAKALYRKVSGKAKRKGGKKGGKKPGGKGGKKPGGKR
jgi:hypothetical protein